MSKSTAKPHFTPVLFEFLRELEANNNREWFAANKTRYQESVRDPFLNFIADFGRLSRSISPHLTADPRPVGGSMFRIYRDIRFSKDKSPYKTHAAAQFPHSAANKSAAPGYYLSLQSGGAFAGGGLWRPDPASLAKVRKAIAKNPDPWKKLRKKIEIEGDRLVRPPKGFDASHPLIEDIKQKDFVSTESFTEAQVCKKDFLFKYLETCKRLSPLVSFLSESLKLPW